MAQFLVVKPLTAAEFETEDAVEHAALTADGAGGARMRMPLPLFPDVLDHDLTIPAGYTCLLPQFTVGQGVTLTVDGTLVII